MSSESDEDFAVYGTGLDPIDEDAVPKKRAVTVEDQVATDKHGRRRFHGAFTGGFSAGFFNTVGSLEGWKPSQFKSSRSSKSKPTQSQRVEDFMDDEDMDEFGIAPKMIRPTQEYNKQNEGPSRKRSLMQIHDGPIPGEPVLRALVEPVRETVGIQLLKKMGWKQGQGVGPRLSKTEKSATRKLRKQMEVKVYGCALPDQQDQSIEEALEESEEEYSDTDVTFAPDDYEPYLVKPKDNAFGLGYSGLDRRPVLSSHVNLFEPAGPSLVMRENKKKVSIRGQAFGVGAFEKEDEDIYGNEDMTQYDFALDTPKMLAEKRQKERNLKSAPSSSSDILEGFIVSSTPLVRKTYPPPPLPQGFTPRHQVKQSRFNASETPKVTVRLSANERAVLINSETLPNKPLPQTPEKHEEAVEVERTVSTFRPFVADPDKQERYEKFLTLSKLGQKDKLRSLQPLTMTEWEQERERNEFEQASRLYRPLSAAFSDRFVSASLPDDSTDPLAPVPRTCDTQDQLKQAAKLKMYGKLTRSVGDWDPHSILCKRFNIPQPGRTSSMTTKQKRPKFSIFNFLEAAPFNTHTPTDEDISSEITVETPSKTNQADAPSGTPAAVDQSDMEVSSSKDNDMEQLIDSTNKMDLYKAIFLSSSDESDGEDEKPTSQGLTNKQPTATELNVLRNTSPPRGIFANLDFDTLNAREKTSSATIPEKKTPQTSTSPTRAIANLSQDSLKKPNQVTNSGESEKLLENKLNEESSKLLPDESTMYGPSLPNLISKVKPTLDYVNKDDSSASEDDWVELNNSSDSDKSPRRTSKKKHNKKSHRKSKRHKEKKRKKKKK